MLLTLPPELQEAIISYLTPPRDLRNVSLASKSLYFLALPYLYRSITISADESQLSYLHVGKILRASQRAENNPLRWTTSIAFSSPILHKFCQRCVQLDHPEGQHDHSSDNPDDHLLDALSLEADELRDKRKWIDDPRRLGELTRLKNRALAVLIRCKRDSLKEFNWTLGTCVPHQILNHNGYLPQRQRNIECLRLITDSHCLGHAYSLKGFPKLKELSWTGLASHDDFVVLQECLGVVGAQLTHLELDLLDRELFDEWLRSLVGEEHAEAPNYMAWYVLGLSRGQTKQVLPRLKGLALASISLEGAEMEIAHALNWSTLQSLKLRYCSGWDGFLKQAISSGQPTRLRRLELQCEDVQGKLLEEEGRTVSRFLEAFRGLEDLRLSGNFATALPIWNAVAGHRSTLRRFVHGLQPVLGPGEDHPAYLNGLPSISLGPDLSLIKKTPSRHPFAGLDLEFLGLTYVESELEVILAPFVNQNTLKAFHIRTSNFDFVMNNPDSDVDANANPAVPHPGPPAPRGSEPGDPATDPFSHGDHPDTYNPWRSTEEQHALHSNQVVPPHPGCPVTSPCGHGDDPDTNNLWWLTENQHAFVQWLFGPKGIRSLQLLAFGDFAYGARRREFRLVFVRNPRPDEMTNYVRLCCGDEGSREVFRRYADDLQACPFDSIIWAAH